MFITFSVDVENWLDHKIKVVESDRGRKYYGKHTNIGLVPGHFLLFLKETHDHRPIFHVKSSLIEWCRKERNMTLMDMLRSMFLNITLPQFLWTKALKTVVHILNRIYSKFFPKKPFEIRTRRKLSLRYLKVWGCPADSIILNKEILT